MYGHHHHRLILFGKTHVDRYWNKKYIKSDADAYAYAQARICWNFIICHTIYRTHNQHCHVNVMAGANCFRFPLFFFPFLWTKFVTAIDLRFSFEIAITLLLRRFGRFFAFTILVVKFLANMAIDFDSIDFVSSLLFTRYYRWFSKFSDTNLCLKISLTYYLHIRQF